MKFSLTLLIAAYNEESTILPLLNDNYKLLKEYKSRQLVSDFEIVILDDGSTDNTEKILLQYTGYPNIRIITNAKPSGIVNAFRLLYTNVTHDWYMLIPGDGQWSSSATQLMLDELIQSELPTAINGVRINKNVIYGLYRKVLSRVYCQICDFVLSQRGSDPGSIKLMPKELADYPFKTRGLMTEIERLAIAKRTLPGGLKFVPVPWVSRIAGKHSGTKFSLVFFSLFSAIKLIIFRL